jgi:hypothetical protein
MIQWFEPPSGAVCGGYGLVARRCRPNKEMVTATATERFAAVAGELLEHDRSLRRSPRSEREEVRRLLSGRSFDYLPNRATAGGWGSVPAPLSTPAPTEAAGAEGATPPGGPPGLPRPAPPPGPPGGLGAPSLLVTRPG